MSYMPKSKTDVHVTPDKVYEIIEKRWSWKKADMFDPCPVNPDFDGLTIPWKDKNYVNPPYDVETLTKFVKKALHEHYLYKHDSVMLLPAKTDQPWFHDFIVNHFFEIYWIRGRLTFKGEKDNAPNSHFLVMIG